MAINRDNYHQIVSLVEIAHKISPSLTSRLVAGFYNKKIDQSIIIKELHCIYMPVPKAGTKSIKQVFADYLYKCNSDARFNTSDINTKGLPFSRISKLKAETLRDDLFVFSFVRNPFKRILSCYFDKIRKKTSYKGFLRYGNQFNRQMSFEEFVKNISCIPDSDADQHFRSQSQFLIGENHKLIPHFTGKLEQFEDGFRKVAEQLNCETLQLNHINKSKAKKIIYEDYFTPQIVDLILERYDLDFQLFGYSPNIHDI